MQRMTHEERTAYGHAIDSMTDEQVAAEVAALNRQVVAAEAAIETLATTPAEPDAAQFDMTDVDEVIALAYSPLSSPAESAALQRARVHRRNLDTKSEIAGQALTHRRAQAARRKVRADMAARAGKMSALVSEMEAHIVAARAAGARPLITDAQVFELRRVLDAVAQGS